jgi:biopolymer transport protein ExbD
LNETPVEFNALGDHFKRAAESSRETQVLIQADERVAHGRVVEVMNLARNAGLSRLAIVTRPKADRER